ncbi:MAG TPA: S-adenosylmethionine:tRNA ribosyltransferase-isomerase [Puia sp.]|nr:S-adenosylmethionine:tRNA ribosyltransferase-isomerase [Puia sp.]
MDAKNIRIADYSYDLPAGAIAYYPLAERDASRLLVYRAGELHEDIYRNIAQYLPEGSFLVFNNTRVVEARIVFQKPTGGLVEIFCLEPPAEYGGVAAALTQTGSVRWKCLIGGASKWKPGQVLRKELAAHGPAAHGDAGTDSVADGGQLVLEARWVQREEGAFLIELSWTPADLSFAELLHRAGLVPLPPYIHRTVESTDSERYQTVYARHDGSVAAPTAGLHFTEAIFGQLEQRGIQRTFVTLHVGAGTFLPVKAATLGEHPMHIEFIAVKSQVIRELLDRLKAGNPVIAVGTTSARTLESLYWLGARVVANPSVGPEDLVVHQWDAYAQGQPAGVAGERDSSGSAAGVAETLQALLAWMERRRQEELVTTTQLLITPGYSWKIVAGLVTNFHQPESTLLLLIASLVGEDWRIMYGYALEHGFRFLSYGDGCLLLPERGNR